jgi:hypothetical protein
MEQNLVDIILWVDLGEGERDSIRAHFFVMFFLISSVGPVKHCQWFFPSEHTNYLSPSQLANYKNVMQQTANK